MQQAHKEFAILKGIIIRHRRDNCIGASKLDRSSYRSA